MRVHADFPTLTVIQTIIVVAVMYVNLYANVLNVLRLVLTFNMRCISIIIINYSTNNTKLILSPN